MSKTTAAQSGAIAATLSNQLRAFEKAAETVRSELGEVAKRLYEAAVNLSDDVTRFETRLEQVNTVLRAASRVIRDFDKNAINVSKKLNDIFIKTLNIEAYATFLNDTVNKILPALADLSSTIRAKADKLTDGKHMPKELSEAVDTFDKLYSYVYVMSRVYDLKDLTARISTLVDEIINDVNGIQPELQDARELAEMIGARKVAKALEVAEEYLNTYREKLEISASKLKQAASALDVTKLVKLKEELDEAYSELEKVLKQQ